MKKNMMNKVKGMLAVIMICFLGGCGEGEETVSVIYADYPEYDTAKSLVNEADLVFSGTVESMSYAMLDVRAETGIDSETGLSQSQALPYTIYKIKVDNVYKGSSNEKYISIKCMGGEIDSIQYSVDGAEVLQEGKMYMFLAKTYENTYPSLLNVSQSIYDMNEPSAVSEEDGEITLSDILALFE